MMCLLALTMRAQRCAEMEFTAGAGISQSDVDGISAIFMTYFRPEGYTMVERTEIDKAIEEQRFQRSSMTERQKVRVGEILNVSKIVVGVVNVVMGQYNVDVRVINVGTGTEACPPEGAVFSSGSDYRSSMRSIAQKLASKISNTSIGTASARPAASVSGDKNRVEGFVDLGLSSGTLWKDRNEDKRYTYDEAVSQFGSRLPTKAQWEELKAECRWTWNGSGYKVTGPNGNSIVLPAEGGRRCDGSVDGVGSDGLYWSSTPKDSDFAWSLDFNSSCENVDNLLRCIGQSVRLVQNK